MVIENPVYVLELPRPWAVDLPSLLDSLLHDSGLTEVAMLCEVRAGQYTAQK